MVWQISARTLAAQSDHRTIDVRTNSAERLGLGIGHEGIRIIRLNNLNWISSNRYMALTAINFRGIVSYAYRDVVLVSPPRIPNRRCGQKVIGVEVVDTYRATLVSYMKVTSRV